jgi:hypothetical protein
MTAAMKAIGAVSDSPKTELQKKKEEILKRLNSKVEQQPNQME